MSFFAEQKGVVFLVTILMIIATWIIYDEIREKQSYREYSATVVGEIVNDRGIWRYPVVIDGSPRVYALQTNYHLNKWARIIVGAKKSQIEKGYVEVAPK